MSFFFYGFLESPLLLWSNLRGQELEASAFHSTPFLSCAFLPKNKKKYWIFLHHPYYTFGLFKILICSFWSCVMTPKENLYCVWQRPKKVRRMGLFWWVSGKKKKNFFCILFLLYFQQISNLFSKWHPIPHLVQKLVINTCIKYWVGTWKCMVWSLDDEENW